MKKIIIKILLILILFNIGTIYVHAQNIDNNHPSSLEINHKYGEIKIIDAKVSIYKIASITETGSYQFQEEYQEVSFDPNQLSSSEQSLKAKEILEYIETKNILATKSAKTNQDGIIEFSDLIPGFYLIQIENKILNNYQYSVLPMLISIPTLENNTYQYQVQINTKSKQEEINQEILPGQDENINVPNTLDNIIFYIILLGISLLVIIVVLYYISKEGRKRENEKANK